VDIGVYCLNVGQGNCVAVIDPLPGGRHGQSQASLIDVGTDGDQLAKWLGSIQVVRIPLIALTHNDEDHVKGLPALIQRYRRRIGRVLFVIDREPLDDIPYYLDAENWAASGLVEEVGRLETPTRANPDMGERLVEEPQTSYRLHCAFPTMHQTEAVVRRAPASGPTPGHGPNDTSGVIRLARPANPKRTRVLFGGDLHYPGWHIMSEAGHDLRTDVLIAPHHGGPRGGSATFGAKQLAAETTPRYVLFSVGTQQRGVSRKNEATAKHPLPEVVRAFRDRGSTVLCTQITRRCHETPGNVAGGSVIPLPPLTRPHDLSPSGSACAGTILIVLRESGHMSVARLNEHQTAVNQLQSAGEHPLCRP
jgi:beta-lactamase superfamily II metal-dependent hydrolase